MSRMSQEETEERNKKLLEDAKSGMSYKQMAQKHNMNPTYISQIVKGMGYVREKHVDKDEIRKDYLGGVTIREIMKKHQVGNLTIKNICADLLPKQKDEMEKLPFAGDTRKVKKVTVAGKRYTDVTQFFEEGFYNGSKER